MAQATSGTVTNFGDSSNGSNEPAWIGVVIVLAALAMIALVFIKGK